MTLAPLERKLLLSEGVLKGRIKIKAPGNHQVFEFPGSCAFCRAKGTWCSPIQIADERAEVEETRHAGGFTYMTGAPTLRPQGKKDRVQLPREGEGVSS